MSNIDVPDVWEDEDGRETIVCSVCGTPTGPEAEPCKQHQPRARAAWWQASGPSTDYYLCPDCGYELWRVGDPLDDGTPTLTCDRCCTRTPVPEAGVIAKPAGDPVNHPPHYTYLKDALGVETIDILEACFPTDPLLWQVGKYLLRAGHKTDELEDLKKAAWYLSRKIDQLGRDAS